MDTRTLWVIWIPLRSSASCMKGARRRGETVDAYRDFIQTTAGRAGVSFEKALQLANYFETLPPGEPKAMVKQLLS